MKTYVVGDIHGWDLPLKELLKRVNFDYEEDTLISLGDLCDRGPNTWEVIEHLLTIKKLIFISGNHDFCFKQYLIGNKEYDEWMNNIGKQTIVSYERNNWKNLEAHKKLLFSSITHYVLSFKEESMCFVHGGFDRYRLIDGQSESVLAWDRQLVNDMINSNGEKLFTTDSFDKIFIGHTPTICWNEGDETLNGKYFALSITKPIYKPIIKSGVYLLDTGCGKGGPLSLYDLDEDRYYQSKKKYSRIKN